MDEFELRVAEHLRTAGGDERPPSALGTRIVSRAGARRRRRRRLTAAAAVGAGATLAVPVAVISTVDRPSPAPDSSAVTVAPLPPATTFSRRLPGGERFKAMALGPDGTVLGGAVAIGADGFVTPRKGVWQVGPGARPARLIADTPSGSLPFLWLMAVGGSGRVWPEGGRLKCLPPGEHDAAHTLKDGWNGQEPFFVGTDVIVWSDPGRGELIVTNGCQGRVRTLPVNATLEAFSHPYAFVRPEPGGRIDQVDVRTGAKTPIQTGTDTPTAFGAGPDRLAWVSGDTLTVRALRSGERRVVHGLPHARHSKYSPRITVGNHIVVYSATHEDTDTARSLVYDLRSGKRSIVQGEAWAAGDLLLWREGDSYRLAHQ
ncbi:hypothetical protein SMC26_24275 [Actinomadura fulvescens]|uniref:WD40 repeat domain-containing protein n=1 Tax=Actinomadura fulvescens TaxID=46160 RepID=A0ABN3Q382_9ACTN